MGNQAKIDGGEEAGLTSEELRRLRRENRTLRMERDLKGRRLLRTGERDRVSIYRFIAAERATNETTMLCAHLGMSLSATRSSTRGAIRRP